MAHLLRVLLPLLALTLVPPAEAGRRRLPDVVEDALAFAVTDRSKALRLLEEALAADPDGKHAEVITVHLAEQCRLAGDAETAEARFRAIITGATRGPDYEAARLGLALMESGGELKQRVRSTLQSVSERDVLDTQNADRFLVLAAAAGREGDARGAAQNAKKALAFASEDPEVYDRVKAALDTLSAEPDAPPPAPAGAPATSGEGESLLDRADAALYANDREKARKLAEQALAAASPDSLAHRSATYMLRRIDGPAVSRTVAVLLPLSDAKYSAIGRQLKEAFEHGYQAEKGEARLVFIESGAGPEEGVAALERAVFEEGALLAVGPLLSPQTEPMVEAAEALRIPLVSLSQALEDLDDLEWTVQAMVTRGDQVDALVEQVMERDGMDAFAVFAPANSYGEQATALFRESVEARGGALTVTGTYDPASTSLIPAAKELGRKDYGSRGVEFAKLRKEAEERGGNPDRVVLPPVLDFDALFLPENAARVPIACAALAYEEFPMGDFQPTKESPRIPLLGLNGWNNDKLVTTGGPYTRGGIFVDAFAVPGEEAPWTLGPGAAAFVAEYRDSHGRTPKALEAITSDAGRLVAAAVNIGADDRLAMREALWSAEVTGAVTGATRFDAESRRADRQLMLLSLTEDHIVPLDVQRSLAAEQQ